ncbi:hypothetical protein GUJ93_ZPchr0010g9555 [Zizania palustris]|uniref:Uncharacterized protein n=1 Tax=Zizania palustris TaxID=103762 RepID=A0A8J5WF02_ZIZPA|nr:hypothetical protein GUJ93_ZPchr0010g9555 [Zizania palustris]
MIQQLAQQNSGFDMSMFQPLPPPPPPLSPTSPECFRTPGQDGASGANVNEAGGELKPLARLFEELLPDALVKREWAYNVALCYLTEEDDLTALNLLQRIMKSGDDSNNIKELLLASKICTKKSAHTEEKASWQCEALVFLVNAEKKMHGKDSHAMYSLSLEIAEQRKLDAAAFYAKKLVKLETGSKLRSWLLLALILTAQKQFADAETIVDAVLDKTWKQEI